ncbi:DNA-binding transcription factor, partial [Elasticomyces elasticus]
GDVVGAWEKEMWEYFGALYKNCNKGIKGRGKDRRISNNNNAGAAALPKMEDASRRGSYASSASDSAVSLGEPGGVVELALDHSSSWTGLLHTEENMFGGGGAQ